MCYALNLGVLGQSAQHMVDSQMALPLPSFELNDSVPTFKRRKPHLGKKMSDL